MVIDNLGNVGIGTDNPTATLEVATSVDGEATLATFKNTSGGGTNETVDIKLGLENTVASNVILRAGKEANHSSGAATDNFFAIHTTENNTSAEKLRITSAGQLQATGAADVRLTLGSAGTVGTNDSVHIRADGANLKFMAASSGNTLFETNGTETLRITSDGAVSIGSGNAAATMSQFGSNTDGLTIDDVGISNTGIKISHGSNNTYLIQSGNSNTYMNHYGSGQMIFGVGSSGQEAFRIDTNRVVRFQNATGDLKVASTTSNDGGKIYLQETTTDAWSLEAQRANGSFFIRDEYNNKERFSILNNGNISVGLKITLKENTTDAFSFHSNGANGYFRLTDEYDNVELMRFHGDGALSINTTNLTNYSQTSNSLNTNNTGGAAGNWSWRRDTGAVIQATDADSGWALMYLNKYEWNSGDDSRWISFYLNGQVRDTISWNGSNIIYGQGSDYRVKENVREFTNGIDKVKQLKVHLYDYIDPDRGTDHIGFIAHELQEIIPDAVSGEKDGMRKEEDTGNDVMDIQMVDYGKLTPVLTAALQEALAKIEALEQRLIDAGL